MIRKGALERGALFVLILNPNNMPRKKEESRTPVTDTESIALTVAIGCYRSALDEINTAHECERRGHYIRPHVYSVDEIKERISELRSIIKSGWAQ